MSCTAVSSRFSRWVAQMSGVTRLAGQRAFYAGVTAGIAGTLGAQQVIKAARHRQAGSFLLPRTPQPGPQEQPRPIPPLEAAPTEPAENSDRREQPRQIPALAGAGPGTRARPRRIPALEREQPPSPLAETRLKPEPIQVRSSSGQVITTPDSYRMVRPDGTDTGLALTPTLNSNGEPEANSWGVTHTASGSLVSGPYPDLKQAQTLATQLAGLRWAGLRVPAPDVEQARQIIAAFQPGGQN